MPRVPVSLPPLPRLGFVAEPDSARQVQFVRPDAQRLRFIEGPARDQTFGYDLVRRQAIDAAVIVAFVRDADGSTGVFLRSALRPPLALRDDGVALEPGLWELPAGLIERGEAPHEAAARELEEELGFVVAPSALVALGSPILPAPALIGERQFGFAVDVTGLTPHEPSLDGSPLELGGVVVCLDAEAVAVALEAESLVDAKTELFLRRFLRSPR